VRSLTRIATGTPPSRRFRTRSLPSPGTVPARLLLRVIEDGGTITTRRAHAVLRRGRVHASQVLSQLAAAGLLHREQWARYAVTPKGLAARAALSDVALYRAGTHRRRLAEWAMERQRPFGVPEVSRLLGISHRSVHTVLKRLLRDRVIEREGPGVYRAT
jgi:Mn-dependent DtxR family transcriptional regulator